jgi:signal transduction histidine kinase
MEERSAIVHTHQAHRQAMHDLRTPLTVLLGRAQLLSRDRARGLHPERLDPDLEVIEAAVLRLAAAVEQVEAREPPAP